MTSLKIIQHNRLWLSEDNFSFFNIQMGVRMTIIRLSNGDLLLHSPIKLSEEIEQSIAELGTVKYLIAPNHLHHLFLKDYLDKYKEIELLVMPKLLKKRPDLKATKLITENLVIDNGLKFFILSEHRFLKEAILFDSKSKSLILTDVIQYHQNANFFGKLLSKFIGAWHQYKVPRDYRCLIKNKEKYQEKINQISELDFDKIIISHEPIIETNAKEIFRECFSFLNSSI